MGFNQVKVNINNGRVDSVTGENISYAFLSVLPVYLATNSENFIGTDWVELEYQLNSDGTWAVYVVDRD